MPCGLDDVASFLDALAHPDAFDAIVSNFGALNCVPHLAALRAIAHRHLRSGGVMMLGLMSRACALEAMYFTATGRPALARRRRASGAVGVCVAGLLVPTFYHRLSDVRAALGNELRLAQIEGIGVALPPPYLEPRWQALPAAVRRLVARIDRALAPWPVFNRLGDHVLLHFIKERTHA
jgi:hypothetical protein